jgi:hypothetical protein
MSRPRISRAEDVLRLAELAARNLQLPEGQDAASRATREAFDSMVGKVGCLKKQASALWKADFEAVLDSSYAMRVERIGAAKSKELLRPLSFKCMACGRAEKNCDYKIDLAGDFDSSAWCGDAGRLTDEYCKFISEYEEVYRPEFGEVWSAGSRLPPVDKGVYIVGETCLRKAVLRFTLQTLMLELCYSAEREMEELYKERSAASFRRDQFYTVTKKKAEALLAKQWSLEQATADEKRHVAWPAVDHSFWAIVDGVRAGVSGGDEAVLDRLLVNRAVCAMRGAASRVAEGKGYAESSEEEDGGSEGDEEAGEEDVSDVEQSWSDAVRRSFRMETCAAGDDQPMRTRSGAALSGAGAGSRGKAKRPRRAVVGDESDGEQEAAAQPAAPALGPREPQPSVSGMVGINRAAGVLPSRRGALLALMNLQTKLFVKGENADAVVCTNAIQTIQELLERVEKLSHTAGI